MLVFVPLGASALRSWAEGRDLGTLRAYGATPSFLEAFGLGEAEGEDAERTLLHVAALDALLRFGGRLVAVVDVEARDLGSDFGGVEVVSPPFSRVTALFADHSDAAGPLAHASRALGDAALDDAWDDPAHSELMETTDLLWFGPEEWGRLAS